MNAMSNSGVNTGISALQQTLLTKVYDVAVETPVESAAKLSARLGCKVYLKREDLQPVHSFKLRGAYNKIAHLSEAERSKGVIAASAGNHAQGVALAAQKLGLSALIVMPRTTPSIKIDAVKSYGADVELAGDSYTEAYEHCLKLVEETGRTFIHPFDDPLVMAGQGTIGREILEQLPDVTHIFVPVGGGGLIAGIAQFAKALRPEIKIIAVQAEDAETVQTSVEQNTRIYRQHVGIFADGTAVKQLGKHTFPVIKELVDEAITVSTDEICAAIKAIFEDTRAIMEPSGALAVAGMAKWSAATATEMAVGGTAKLSKSAGHDKTVAVAVCSGANISFERLQFVAERTLLGSGHEALFAVTMPERPGALHQFCQQVVNGHNITEFCYRLQERDEAHIFVGVTVGSEAEKQALADKMTEYGFEHCDLADDDVAKEHIRYMVGGLGAQTRHERLYQVNFPERPGALSDFLERVGDTWNISLFHYRGMGGDIGRVLIGFETDDVRALEDRLTASSYEFEPVSSEAASIFLGYNIYRSDAKLRQNFRGERTGEWSTGSIPADTRDRTKATHDDKDNARKGTH